MVARKKRDNPLFNEELLLHAFWQYDLPLSRNVYTIFEFFFMYYSCFVYSMLNRCTIIALSRVNARAFQKSLLQDSRQSALAFSYNVATYLTQEKTHSL